MKGKTKIFIIVFAFALTVMSCANKDNKNVLSKDEMTSILIDVHLLESKMILLKLKSDSMKRMYNTLEKSILEGYGTNKVEYEYSYGYYMSQPEELELIYDRVVDSLNLINQVAQVESDKVKDAAKLKKEAKERAKEVAAQQLVRDSINHLEHIDSMLLALEFQYIQTRDTSLFFVQNEIPIVEDTVTIPWKSEFWLIYDSLKVLQPEVFVEEVETDEEGNSDDEMEEDEMKEDQRESIEEKEIPKSLSKKINRDSIRRARKIQDK